MHTHIYRYRYVVLNLCVFCQLTISVYVLDPMILVLVVSAGADKHQVLAG